MAKGYMVSCYRSVSNPEKLADYARLAGPAIIAAGGTFLARGTAARAMEDGIMGRTVIIEFESLEAALALYDNPMYQEAVRALGEGSVERDMRIVEGV